MALTLVCLHGFTQNCALLSSQLGELTRALPNTVEVVCPDAPHACSQDAIERISAAFKLELQSPPHLCWWNANDDGTLYSGWDTTLEQLRVLCERPDRPARVGVLGFSQGAIAATALAALQQAGQFPALSFAVLVAGRRPRASVLQPLMAAALSLPSLHVWGERDAAAREGSAALVEAFAPDTRNVVNWPGAHELPTQGPAAQAIVDFVAGYA